jgi:hypothetical protein
MKVIGAARLRVETGRHYNLPSGRPTGCQMLVYAVLAAAAANRYCMDTYQ